MFNLVSNFLDLFDLPDDIEWYEVDGRKVFELTHAGSGGLGVHKIAYLIQRESEKNNKRWYKYGIMFNLIEQMDRQKCIEKINTAINEFQKKLLTRPESNVDPDGGSLGLDGF